MEARLVSTYLVLREKMRLDFLLNFRDFSLPKPFTCSHFIFFVGTECPCCLILMYKYIHSYHY